MRSLRLVAFGAIVVAGLVLHRRGAGYSGIQIGYYAVIAGVLLTAVRRRRGYGGRRSGPFGQAGGRPPGSQGAWQPPAPGPVGGIGVPGAPSSHPQVPSVAPQVPSVTPQVPSVTPRVPSGPPGVPTETPGTAAILPGVPPQAQGTPPGVRHDRPVTPEPAIVAGVGSSGPADDSNSGEPSGASGS